MGKKVKSLLSALRPDKPLLWLLMITLLGGVFRFYNPAWDYQKSFHPDERNILGQTPAIQATTGYKVTFFAYGQLPVYLYRATGELISTPALFQQFFHNEFLAAVSYWLLLVLVFGGLLTLFLKLPFPLSNFTWASFVFSNFFLWYFCPIFSNQGFSFLCLLFWGVLLGFLYFFFAFLKEEEVPALFPWAYFAFSGFILLYLSLTSSSQGFSFLDLLFKVFLLGLLALLYFLLVFLKEEGSPILERTVAGFVFLSFLVVKFFPIFVIWAKALDDAPFKIFGYEVPLKLLSFLLVSGVALALSWIAAELLETEWVGMPLYGVLGTVFLFGLVPLFLSSTYAQICGAIAFMVLVAGALFAWAFYSNWGRFALALFSFWTILAALNHWGLQFTGYGECMVIGRLWSAAFSTTTIVAVYFLVKRLYQNYGMALLASAFTAFAVVSIEQAHYCITESFITMMFVLVVLCAWEILKKGDWNSYLLAGGAFGFSMAAKTSSLYYVFIIATAHLVWLSQKSAKDWEREDKKLGENRWIYSIFAGVFLVLLLGAFLGVGWKFKGVIGDLFHYSPASGLVVWLVLFTLLAALGVVFALWGLVQFKVLRAQMPQWIKLAATGGLAFLLFCLFSPWSLLDFNGFMISQNYEWQTVSIADACYVLQFKDTPRYLYQLKNLVNVELWWPLGLAAVAGMFWVLIRFTAKLVRPVKSGYLLPVPFLKGKGFAFSLADLLLLCWFIPYFGFIGAWNTKFVRYMVPLIPAFCIFGAKLLSDLIQWARSFSWGRVLKPAIWVLIAGPSLFYSIAYMHVYRFQNPWIESSVWIYEHVPFGSKIFNEAWGDGLPVDLNHSQDPRIDQLMTPGLYHSMDITPYELHGFPTDDSPVKKNYYANLLPQGDYISISSKKLWYTLTDETPEFRPHGFNWYPVTSRYYRCLWSGLLGYKMVYEYHNFPSFLGWEHPDDMAEESFSVYDHPRVYLFKKVEEVPPARILKLLETDDYVKGINRDIMRDITPANVDRFIAERRQYLVDHGLWAQLEASAPTATAMATTAPVPAAPGGLMKPVSTKPRTPKGATPVAAGGLPTTLPTPEVKVEAPATVPGLPDAKTLQVLQDLTKNPVIEDDVALAPPNPVDSFAYQLRAWFSWVVALILLGWMAMPLTLRIFPAFPHGAYSLSKILGFFVFAWVVWFSTSLKVCYFTFGSCWVWFILLAGLSLFSYWRDKKAINVAYTKWSKVWMIQEGVFVLMFLLFTLIKIYIPHIHDPGGEGYNGGGEAGMDYGFLASVVRGETFPPQNMWMAGQPIGYSFYYGHLMMGILTKFLGLVPAITYNLGLITLFALIFSGAFGLAYSLSGRLVSGWIAGLLCAVAGNPDGAKQLLDAFQQCLTAKNFSPLLSHVYDFWGPTRVIPFGNNTGSTINEFPYFSVLYGDLHAHTLAMPFAMLLIGVIASIFLSKNTQPFRWRQDWPVLLIAGFVLGGVAFLNTWEVPTWLVLLGVAYLVRNISGLNPKTVQLGLRLSAVSLLVVLTLLGWYFRSGLARGMAPFLGMDISENALGGTTGCLVFFFGLAAAVATLWLWLRNSTRVLAKQYLTIGISIAVVLAVAGILWAPYFAGFHPQQNKIMWVKPDIRTSLVNYFSVHGFFLTILLVSFLVAYSKGLQNWLSRNIKAKFDLDSILDSTLDWLSRLVMPTGAVGGAMALGLFSLALIWCASWVHWTEMANQIGYSQLLATLTVAPFALAVYFKDRLEYWAAGLLAAFLWSVLLILKVIHLSQGMSLTLDLWLFSVLWLLAFFHLGLAIKTFGDRALSFSYILVSMFFFVTATLEVFVMSEYFGFGDGMRNNSMFKYGINAWTLASVGAGIFLPKVYDALRRALKAPRKEANWPRWILFAGASFFLYVMIRSLLDSYLVAFSGMSIPIIDMVLIVGYLIWALMENWLKNAIAKGIAIALSVIFALIPLLSLPQVADSGGFYAILQRWCSGVAVEFFFPLLLAVLVVFFAHFFWEGKKGEGIRVFFLSWRLLLLTLALAISVYPLCSTERKCHGFLDSSRKQWVGYAENLTLNGLAYLPRETPFDAAAIRFMNDRIPDQPCLLEFVGAGYNSWGSRFSIFTGIPALMGWDGHVGEWVGARLGDDIHNRTSATQQIFSTTDPVLAKRMLDAYGIRLVMVGSVERHGTANVPGYPPEGLAKFSSFLPLIYKNPQVEIYYNPPSAK